MFFWELVDVGKDLTRFFVKLLLGSLPSYFSIVFTFRSYTLSSLLW